MDPQLRDEIQKRLSTLPAVVRDAIATIDIEKQLRAVSDNHKLHVDQWAILENEVMLTLLGFQEPVKLPANIQREVGVDAETAESLANDINTIVFEPIRQELERQLEHPEAQEKQLTAEEAARQQILAGENAATAPTVAPATPPPPKPTEKAERAPISSAYSARESSSVRKDIANDPYREAPL